MTEIGPRLKLRLVKIEEGVCDGQVLFHEFITKTPEELEMQKEVRERKRYVLLVHVSCRTGPAVVLPN